jgi:predicted butyrate kinase (DUF1464 family)
VYNDGWITEKKEIQIHRVADASPSSLESPARMVRMAGIQVSGMDSVLPPAGNGFSLYRHSLFQKKQLIQATSQRKNGFRQPEVIPLLTLVHYNAG